MNHYTIFNYIGLYAPIFLFFLTFILLRNQTTYLHFFVAGFILNNVLNILLKLLFKQPRPSNDIKTLEIVIVNGARISFDKFGMPSGHAQNCGFCLTFIFLTLNNPFYTFLYLFITKTSLFQRYLFQNHSILQIIIGLFVGILFGYFTFLLANKFIIGNITLKKDDNAPM